MNLAYLFAFSIFIFSLSCGQKGEGYKPPFLVLAGSVLGKEDCKSDEAEDYWLVNLKDQTLAGNEGLGDTIVFDGIQYNHVVKTLGLNQEFKRPFKEVLFDCVVTNKKITTTKCTAVRPRIFELKVMRIISQAEQR